MKKPKPLTIKDRPAIVGKAYKGHHVREESEGGDEGGDAGELIPARDVRFTNVMLDPKQFDQLVGEQAYNSFFNQNRDTHEPAFTSFSKLWLDNTYKNCSAKIVFGVSANEIEIDSGTIKNISVKPFVGGMAELAFTLVAAFPRDLSTLDFECFAGKEVSLSVVFGPIDHAAENQQQLPLDAPKEAKPIDKTRIVDRKQQGEEAETSRQLGEALRGLEKGKTKAKRDGKAAAAGAH